MVTVTQSHTQSHKVDSTWERVLINKTKRNHCLSKGRESKIERCAHFLDHYKKVYWVWQLSEHRHCALRSPALHFRSMVSGWLTWSSHTRCYAWTLRLIFFKLFCKLTVFHQVPSELMHRLLLDTANWQFFENFLSCRDIFAMRITFTYSTEVTSFALQLWIIPLVASEKGRQLSDHTAWKLYPS